MKYRLREEDGKHVTTIEDDKGKRLDEKPSGSHKAAMELRDKAQDAGVKAFADLDKKAEPKGKAK